MGRGNKLKARICINDNGKIIPYLLIDEDKNVTWLVSEEERKRYEQIMLNNIGEGLSRHFNAFPEKIPESWKGVST